MKFKERTNKIISFVLAIATVISTLSPAFTSTVQANTIHNNVEPQVEYTDSGFLPEEVVTGTDFDNFSISLKYGYINDPLGDTLSLTDAEIQVPITINIEYRGDQSYAAGDISFTMNDIETLIRNKNYRHYSDSAINYRNDLDGISYDIGAELVGSGSGRGDWYYTVETNSEENGKYVFTNKNLIDTSFTSSIEFVVSLRHARVLISGFEDTFSSVLTVNNQSKKSNTLSFSYKTTGDTFSINKMTSSGYTYTTYSADSSTYAVDGYNLNDYYVMTAEVYIDWYKNNRGLSSNFESTIQDGAYAYIELKTEDGIVLIPGDSDYKKAVSDNNLITNTINVKKYKTYTYYNNTSSTQNQIPVTVFIPKDKYSAGDIIDLKVSINGNLFDEFEAYNDTETLQITIKEVDVTVLSGKVIARKQISPLAASEYELNINNGITIQSTLRNESSMTGITNTYTSTDTSEEGAVIAKTIIDDNLQFFGNSTSSTDTNRITPTLDEYYVKSVTFAAIPTDSTSTVDIYVLPYGQSEYELYGTYNIVAAENSTQMSVTIDRKDIQHVKFEINGSYNPIIYLYSYLNWQREWLWKADYFYFYNYADITQITVDNTCFTRTVSASMSIQKDSAKAYAYVSASNYSVSDGKLNYTISGTNKIEVSGFKDTNQNLEVYKIKSSFTYPSIFNLNPEDYTFKFANNTTNSCFRNLESRALTVTADSIPFFMNIDYEVIDNNNGTKTINYIITVDKEHGMLTTALGSSGSVGKSEIPTLNYTNNLYMDFDTYSGLKVQGKLPASTSIMYSTTAYPEETNFSNFKWNTYAERSSKVTIPTLAGSTFEGVEKFVNTGLGYTKDVSMVDSNRNYSYKLRLSGGQTKVDNIVFYDNLEEAYGENEFWKGTFVGLDTTLLDMYFEGEENSYTVYYSTDKNQAFDLTADGWIEAADWTQELSNVKSIAVDLDSFTLLPTSTVYVIVNMKAPDNTIIGSKAYNSYAADYKAYDANTGIQLEDIKALPSNITEIVLNKLININVNKIWSGADPVTDSIDIGLIADGTQIKTATLTKGNNWSYTFNGIDTINSSGSIIKYSVAEINKFQRFETTYDTISDNDSITYTITNTRIPDDTYNFEKEWIIEGKDNIVLSLIEDSDLSLEEQKSSRANKTFNITASGEGLEDVIFEVAADVDGNITIPDSYNNYTDFSLILENSGKTYNCYYKIEYKEPEKPESININTSDSLIPLISLLKENDYKGTYKFSDYNVEFLEEDIEDWKEGTSYNGLAITFNENCKTYNSSDYLYIYYKYNNLTYRTSKYYSSALAGQTIEIPSTDIYFYWVTGSSDRDYYGFSIDKIENKEVTTVLGSSGYNLPSGVEVIEISATEYPESEHNPYLKNQKKLWHYDELTSGNDNITVTKTGDFEYSVKITNTGKQIASIVASDISVKKYNYNFNKVWDVEISDLVLGYIESNNLTADEYKTLMAGKTIEVKSSSIGTVLFTTTADENGLITVPTEHTNNKTLYFKVDNNGSTYEFNYDISKKEPLIPDSITLIPSIEGYDEAGNKVSEIVLTKENNWKGTYKFDIPSVTFTEVTPDGWQESVTTNGLAITFNENFKTPSSSYGYLYIYYNYNGILYRTSKYYGSGTGSSSLAGKTINIPATDFWIYWYGTNISSYRNYYGFSIDSIVGKDVSTTIGSSGYSIPTTVEAIELNGNKYPETSHNPFNSGYVLWHYTASVLPDNITVTQNGDAYDVNITNNGTATYDITGNIVKKYDFDINKEWTVIDTNSIVLGYSADSGLTADEYKTILSNKALNITASGEGLEDASIEATADENGNITIPDEYKGHTDFAFEVEYNNKVYQFNYKVSRTDPVKPASITVIPSVSGYDNEGNEITEITLTEANNWTTTVKFTDPTVTFTEKDVAGWSGEINVVQNGEVYTVSIKNTGVYSYASTVKVDNKEFTYNIEKEWKFEDIDFTIGYLADSGLTEEEYKSIVGNKTVNIIASGDGLENATFEAIADENGSFVIPAQYGSYTTLTFQVISNNNAYNFTYNVSKSQPVIPDAIKLYSSNGDMIIIKKSEGWTTEFVSEIMNLQFTEELGQTTGELVKALSSIGNDYGIALANDIIIDDDVIIEGGDVIIGGETITPVDYTIKNYLSGALISSVNYSTDTTNTTYATIFAEIENNLATFATQNDCKLINYTVKNASGVVVNSTDTISSGKLTVEANYEPNTGLGGSAVMIFYTGDLEGSFDTERSDYSELFEHLEEEAQKFAQQEGAIYDGILVTTLDGKEINSTDPITDLDVLVYVNLLFAPEIGVEQFTVRISISGENISDNFTVDTQENNYELPFQMIENRIKDKGYNQDPYYTGYKVVDSMTGKEAKPSDNITGGTLQVQLQYSNPLKDFESEVSVEKVDDSNYNVKVVNTGKYIYTTTSTLKVEDVNKDITITKEWIIPEDFIKLNIKDTLGYEGNYDKVEILKADTVLETIVKPDEAGLLVSANKYAITEIYTVKIYMTDGTTKTATINENKFELVPVEIELFDGETSLGVFELNEENNWQATVSVPANAELTIKEITTGNWTYEVNDTVITNTVNQEIEITDITVPVPGEIIDTGNDALPTYVLVIFFTGLAGLATSLLLSRKKKNR